MRTVQLTALSALISAGSALGAPDLICSQINGANTYGPTGDAVFSYAFGTTMCNVGDTQIQWEFNSPAHPIISQSVYRLLDGRIEQVGIGFVKHALVPLQNNACDLGCSPAPNLELLGVGCSTQSSASINGSQPIMGPRLEVDASTGEFAFPYTAMNTSGDPSYKRIQIKNTDLNLAGARYFVETQVVLKDEFGHGTSANNASYRPVDFQTHGLATLSGSTHAGKPAIYVWLDHGLGMDTPDPSVMIEQIQIPGDGIVFVGSKVTDLGNGKWRYDYAIQNLNSDRGIGSVSIPEGGDGTITHQGAFHDVDYHDDLDELISGEDWHGATRGTAMFWQTESYQDNELANAIRWGTLYNFSVISRRPSMQGSLELGLFKPGETDSVSANALVPQTDQCLIDVNGDGFFDALDFSRFLNEQLDLTGDQLYDFLDISLFVNGLGTGCP